MTDYRGFNIVTIIQTRTGSTRFPEKVLKPLGGKPLFIRLVERLRCSALTGDIIVATTNLKADDVIERLCRKEQIICFRGHPTDLLDRHYQAALSHHADVAVKIPSDCPLIDPCIIDRVIDFYFRNRDSFDYVSNLHPATYPDGNDVEVISMPALRAAWVEANRDFEREHTTAYIWENPDRFSIGNVAWEKGLDYSMSHRWVIDYEEDYRLIRRIYDELATINPFFGIDDILDLLADEPEIMDINKHLAGVNWYRNHLTDLKTVNAEQTRLEPIERC